MEEEVHHTMLVPHLQPVMPLIQLMVFYMTLEVAVLLLRLLGIIQTVDKYIFGMVLLALLSLMVVQDN
jgi:hypothetical protein